MNRAVQDFLKRHGMSPNAVQPSRDAGKMTRDMERGLAGQESSMPMIPTYLSNDGIIPEGEAAVVIDAGGTNFRCGLVRFQDGGCKVEELKKCRMPGIEKPASWDEFISFVADNIQPLLDRADKIGFCFSYTAVITENIDGRVVRIDKEVSITESDGKLVGASLLEELHRRGIDGKSVVILNDTVAVLLGGSANLDKSRYSGFVGQVSGTGTNTCCAVPLKKIGKLNMDEECSILVNLESGLYDGIAFGEFDVLLDSCSNNPGQKKFEKITAGVYLGELVHLMLKSACEEGLLSAETAAKVQKLGKIDSAVIDAWACGEKLDEISSGEDDGDFVMYLSRAVFERSARCMCTNLIAILLLTDVGKDKPACICAEGSLVQKGRFYRPVLEELLREEAGEKLGLMAELRIGEDTTLSGSAAAALLNA